MKNKKLFLSMLFLLILVFLISCRASQPTPHGAPPINRPLYVLQDPSIGPVGSTHEHSALLIFVNGNVLDLSRPEYMIRSRPVHIENLDGSVIHNHATGITIGHFLETLGLDFDRNCFRDDRRNSYCNEGEGTIKFYVNGNQNNEFNNYVIKHNDRLLISYGNEDNINGQLNFLNNINILS